MTDDFYRPHPGALQQGDILLAPFLRAQDVGGPEPLDHLGNDGQRIGELTGAAGSGQAIVELRLCVVASHDCHLDKQYNRRLGQLRAEGMKPRPAKVAAEDDRSLDRWIVVAPVVELDQLTADATTVRNGDAVGLMYLPAHEDAGFPEAAIDLALKSTVDRQLTKRVAGLTETAADRMRMGLMRVDLARRSQWQAVEDAVGAKIRDVVIDEGSPLKARLILSNGDELAIAHPPQAGSTAGPSRTERSAP